MVINVTLGVLYFMLAKTGLIFSLPPGYVTAIWPPAGLAFASCLIWGGRRVWPGILVGSLISNAMISDNFDLSGVALIIAVGSTAQALIGEFFLRRVDDQIELDRPRSVGMFGCVALVSCLVAPAVGNSGLFALGLINVEQLPQSIFTWWAGDSLGVLIFLPLTLVLFDPRPFWRKRRLQVGIPLLSAFLLCALVYQVARNDEEHRLKDEFSGHAESMIAELSNFGEGYSRGLKGLAEMVNLLGEPTPGQFSDYVTMLRHEYPMLTAVAWVPLIRRDALSSFEESQSKKLSHPLTVKVLAGHEFSADGWVAPVTMINPISGNEAALGRDLLSDPVRSHAVRKAWLSKQVAGSEKISLVQDPSGPGGILLVTPTLTTVGDVTGFVVGVINLRDILRPLSQARNLSWSLRDLTSNTLISETLIDAPSFAQSTHIDRRGVYLQRKLNLADRELNIVLHTRYLDSMSGALPLSSIVMLLALITSAGLGMFTLVVSGTSGHVAKTVEERTLQLREEIERRVTVEQSLQGSLMARKQSMDELDSLRLYNQNIIDSVGEGLHGIDLDGNILFQNPAAIAMLGWESGEAIGKPAHALMHHTLPNGLPYHECDCAIHATLTDGAVRRIDNDVFWRKDGSSFPIEFTASPLLDVTGKISGVVVAFSDITERKEIDRMKSEFISTVSHELRTPLTSIHGALSLLTGIYAGNLPDNARLLLDTAKRNSERLTVLINDILDLEKMDSGRLDFEFEILDLSAVAYKAVLDNEGYGQKHGVHLHVSESEENAMILADGHRLMQVFSNLISNAVKYSPKGATVEVSVCRRGNQFRASVRDTGPGIPIEFRQRIFRRFAQADSSDTREKGGTGLGLSITKAIIERHNGTIDFSCVENAGTEFFFDVPEWREII